MVHFRFRGTDIEVCRLSVSPDTGKEQRQILGVIRSADLAVNDALRSACTSEELAEIETRLSRHKQTDRLQAELAARTLPEHILQTCQWLSSPDGEQELIALADDIRAGWQRLRRTLEQRKLI